VRVSSKNQG